MKFDILPITADMVGKTLLLNGDHYFAEDVFARREADRLAVEAAAIGVDLSLGPDGAIRAWALGKVREVQETTVNDLREAIPEQLIAAFGAERDAYGALKAALKSLNAAGDLETDALRAESAVTIGRGRRKAAAAQAPAAQAPAAQASAAQASAAPAPAAPGAPAPAAPAGNDSPEEPAATENAPADAAPADDPVDPPAPADDKTVDLNDGGAGLDIEGIGGDDDGDDDIGSIIGGRSDA